MDGGIRSRVSEGWATPEAARRYTQERFRSERAERRDQRLVERLLRRHSSPGEHPRVLDVPHGSGRLTPLLERWSASWTGLDASPGMLAAARARAPRARLVLGDAAALPLADSSFDLVLCCRLLHHLEPEPELRLVLGELVRVSRELVVASFWDAASWQGWRRRCGLRSDASGRRPIAKRQLEALLEGVGARVLDYAHGLRHVSLQTFFLARKQR